MTKQNISSILKTPYQWGEVQCSYTSLVPNDVKISNVHIVPFVQSECVLLNTVESGWAMPGGTRGKYETIAQTIKRELSEELGAEMNGYTIFGSWDCVSRLTQPYRPHLPHPLFNIALGWADITIIGRPMSDGGVEKETVKEVLILPVAEAVKHLINVHKPHIAALYALANEKRKVARE